MNYAKRMLMGVGVVVIAAMIVALIAPNTAHGLVAALVQVTNTAANPVPTVATDDPSTEPSSWESIASGTSGSYIHATAFTVPTTTEGGKIVKQLVWESVSVTCRNLDEPFRGVRVVWQGPSTTTNTEYFLPFVTTSDSSKFVTSQLIRIYVDPGGLFNLNLLDPQTLGRARFRRRDTT